MSLQLSNNDIIKSAVDIFESVSKAEQDRLLRLLKMEKARMLARKLDKQKLKIAYSDSEITKAIYNMRKSHGA